MISTSQLQFLSWCTTAVWAALGVIAAMHFAYHKILGRVQPMWFCLSMLAMRISVAQGFELNLVGPVVFLSTEFASTFNSDLSELLAHFVVAIGVVLYVYKVPRVVSSFMHRKLSTSLAPAPIVNLTRQKISKTKPLRDEL